jgi:hypothetical protein
MRRASRLLLASALLFLTFVAGCGSIPQQTSSPYDLPPNVRELQQRWERVHRDYCRANHFEAL